MDIVSPMDIPPFASSAMDGYAVQAADLSAEGGQLAVVDHIPAGKIPQKKIGSGQCARIMTGAPVPEVADTVVPVEWTAEDGDVVTVDRGASRGKHVRPAAEDVGMGDVVMRAGDVITPGAAGMLATMGIVKPSVAVRPSVAVISTGDEVIHPSLEPRFGQIRNSNGPVLQSLVHSFGGVCNE